ncbi:MAG: DUF481 domain-containing protein [Kiritimatiellae bacterium]|jgi:putative salt-induced outer membrane protein|nr:DUF481 domain-containing protein [Kiritimatiellia bacterium]
MNTYYRWITISLLAAASTFGDVVIFKSGDKLTGKVVQMADGKMTFDSAAAGKISLNMDDIQTFSTDESITIEMADGAQLQLQAIAGEPGKVVSKTDETSMVITDIAEINPAKPKWSGAVVAGATLARGNTKSDSFSVDANAQKRRENDRISLAAGYRQEKQTDQNTGLKSTTTDNWFLRGKYDYFMNEKLYLYVNALYEKDKVANLDMRFAPGAGFGYQWIEKTDVNFFTEGGPSWVYERFTDPDESQSYMAIRLAYHLDKVLYKNVKAFHNVEYLPSAESVDTFLVNADAGIQIKLVSSWIMEAKAEMQHNSQPADDREKSDYRYILGLGWTF